MPNNAIEFKIPKPIGQEKVGNLEIPLYGFVFQSEEETFEWAMNDYFQETKEYKQGATPNVRSTNIIAAALLRQRVDPAWTPEEVAKRIPWNFASKLFKILSDERTYEARKKEEEAAALKETETANTSESSRLPIGGESDIS
jgi:hypothetical protein